MDSTTQSPTSPTTALLSNRNFVLLWLGQAISRLGDTVFDFTLLLWIAAVLARQEPWSPLAVSGILVAQTLPMILIGPIAGVFVDRWDKRRLMLWMDLLRALLVASLLPVTGIIALPTLGGGVLPVQVQLWVVYSVVFLASACSQFFTPARVALTGDIVPATQQARAASFEQVTESLSLILGPLFAAPLLFGVGMQWALLINALSFLLSLFTILAIHAPVPAHSVMLGQRGHLRREFGQGLRFTFSNRVIRTLFIALFVAMLGIGAYNALYVFFFLQTLHAPGMLIGLLEAIFGGGVIVGAVLAGVFAQRIGLERILSLAGLAAGVAFVIMARMTNIGAAVGVIVLVGMSQGGFGVTFWPLVLKATPRELVGRVAAILNPSPTLASLVSITLAGYLASTVLRGWHANILGVTFGPIDTILTGAGVLLVLAGLYLLKNLHDETPEALSQPQFAAIAEEVLIESK
jgi:MFS family permease